MKKTGLMRVTGLMLLTACLGGGLTGCGHLFGTAPTGVDVAKLSQAESALEPIGAGAIRRVLKNSPQHAEEIGTYMRAVGAVFCAAQEQKAFTPDVVIASIDAIATPKIGDDTIIDVKNALTGVYKIFWGDRFRAEFPPDEWMSQVCKLICNSVDTGLKDAGQLGTK